MIEIDENRGGKWWPCAGDLSERVLRRDAGHG